MTYDTHLGQLLLGRRLSLGPLHQLLHEHFSLLVTIQFFCFFVLIFSRTTLTNEKMIFSRTTATNKVCGLFRKPLTLMRRKGLALLVGVWLPGAILSGGNDAHRQASGVAHCRWHAAAYRARCACIVVGGLR